MLADEVLYYENFDLENIVTPVNVSQLNQLLIETNYDRTKTKFLTDGFTRGFDIGYRGKMDVRQTAPNLRFNGIGNKLELWNKVMKEVKEKRYAGPYDTNTL